MDAITGDGDAFALAHIDPRIGLSVHHLVIGDDAVSRSDGEESIHTVAIDHVAGQLKLVDARQVYAILAKSRTVKPDNENPSILAPDRPHVGCSGSDAASGPVESDGLTQIPKSG